jgi:hypothetical protein
MPKIFNEWIKLDRLRHPEAPGPLITAVTPDRQAVATATKRLSVVDAGNYAEAVEK